MSVRDRLTVYVTPPEPSQPSLLEELLVIDGVTDLAVYRILTGRWEPRHGVTNAVTNSVTAESPAHQAPLFLLSVPGGGP